MSRLDLSLFGFGRIFGVTSRFFSFFAFAVGFSVAAVVAVVLGVLSIKY
jgi:hypothetical protein